MAELVKAGPDPPRNGVVGLEASRSARQTGAALRRGVDERSRRTDGDGAPCPLCNPVDVFDFVEPIRSEVLDAAGRNAKIERLKEATEFLRD